MSLRVRMPARLLTVVRSSASAAVFSAFWQAAGSFVLQVVAAHLLGASGLGAFALCLGVIVLTTAFTNGFVGDSLTVLDRTDPRIRAGLQVWTVVLSLAGPGATAVVLWATGTLSGLDSLAFVAAASFFQFEEAARRLLMARFQFWSLVVVDSSAVLVSLGTVVASSLLTPITLRTFLGAVAVGQLVGLLVALRVVGAEERWLAPVRGADCKSIASFGIWRGAQVAVNPTLFTAMRVLVLGSAGAAAVGHVEAARIYLAPTIIAIGGLSSYIFANYARRTTAPLPAMVREATRSSIAIGVGVLAVGGTLWLLAPVLGPLITGRSFDLSSVAIVGWSVYAAAAASFMPLINLAVSRGRQRAALGVRAMDLSLAIGSLALLLAVGMPYVASPFVLAVGPFFAGIAIRLLIIRPMLRAERSSRAVSTASPAAAPNQTPASPKVMVS